MKWLGRLDFEPGDGGTKNRCLTTWLRPNASQAQRPYISVFEKHNRAERTQGAAFEQARICAVATDCARLPAVYSPQTASSLPAGSRKWNRLPPGKEKIGLTILPPADSTAASVASRSSE